MTRDKSRQPHSRRIDLAAAGYLLTAHAAGVQAIVDQLTTEHAMIGPRHLHEAIVIVDHEVPAAPENRGRASPVSM